MGSQISHPGISYDTTSDNVGTMFELKHITRSFQFSSETKVNMSLLERSKISHFSTVFLDVHLPSKNTPKISYDTIYIYKYHIYICIINIYIYVYISYIYIYIIYIYHI